MKIVVFTWWRKHYMSYRHHIGMMKRLDNCEIYDREYLEQYKDKLENKIIELNQKHKPDVVICYGAMTFIDYGKIFNKIKSLKVCIEPDYHNHYGKEKWYNQFDMVALRNGNSTLKFEVPTFWWPWSVDMKEFKGTNDERRNVIGFAGSSKHHLYTIRNRAINILTEASLLENMRKTIMANECSDGMWQGKWTDQGKYQKYLRSINGILTSTENRGPFAKTFEGMASETIILTSPIINSELLFGNKTCYIEYKEDCSDIIEKARIILNENLIDISNNAYKECKKKHTNEKRTLELTNNIKNMISGKDIVKKWGL